jgi:glutaredoxin 3
MKKTIVYSTPTCPYCVVAKDFLKNNNIEFEAKDVAVDEVAREEMIKKTGQMGVPVIDIDGEIIIGFNEGRIRELLDIK